MEKTNNLDDLLQQLHEITGEKVSNNVEMRYVLLQAFDLTRKQQMDYKILSKVRSIVGKIQRLVGKNMRKSDQLEEGKRMDLKKWFGY
jgi:hypothetical protein